MKSSARLFSPILILIFLAGCSMFRPQPTGTLFSFDYEGKTYEIAGYVNQMGESANYLTLREGDKVVFRALDRNRSGIIDQVVSGSMSVMEANEIYQAGIQIAMERDLFKNIEKNRTFEYQYEEYQLMVESYQKREGEFHNRFVVFDINWNMQGIFWDDDSDGAIDRRETGDIELEMAQELYSMTIQEAQRKNRIAVRDDDQIIINKNMKGKGELAGVSE